MPTVAVPIRRKGGPLPATGPHHPQVQEAVVEQRVYVMAAPSTWATVPDSQKGSATARQGLQTTWPPEDYQWTATQRSDRMNAPASQEALR